MGYVDVEPILARLEKAPDDAQLRDLGDYCQEAQNRLGHLMELTHLSDDQLAWVQNEFAIVDLGVLHHFRLVPFVLVALNAA